VSCGCCGATAEVPALGGKQRRSKRLTLLDVSKPVARCCTESRRVLVIDVMNVCVREEGRKMGGCGLPYE